MKFTVERDALHDGLSAVASRTKDVLKIPILTHVLVTADDEGVSLMSHDTASCCIMRLPADVAVKGACAIPADRLQKLVSGLPKAGTVIADATDRQVTIKCGRARYSFPILPAKDFPNALTPKDPIRLDLSNEDIRRAFKVPSFVIRDDETRPYMAGVCLHEKDGMLFAVGTDGHSLIRVGTNTKAGKLQPVIVPRAAFAEILAVAGKGGATIEVTANLLAAEAGGRRFVTRLIDAIFPGYEHIIAPPSPHAFVIDANALDGALARLLAASETRPVVRLSWGDDGNISASLRSQLGEGAEEVECDHGGKPAGEVGIQLPYIRALIEAAGGSTVKMSVGNTGEAVRFDNPNDDSFVAVCLPIGMPPTRAEAS